LRQLCLQHLDVLHLAAQRGQQGVVLPAGQPARQQLRSSSRLKPARCPAAINRSVSTASAGLR
jgi:hypothetical protein